MFGNASANHGWLKIVPVTIVYGNATAIMCWGWGSRAAILKFLLVAARRRIGRVDENQLELISLHIILAMIYGYRFEFQFRRCFHGVVGICEEVIQIFRGELDRISKFLVISRYDYHSQHLYQLWHKYILECMLEQHSLREVHTCVHMRTRLV